MSQAVDELLSELAKHLKASVPELVEVHEEFPEANQVLEMPCATLFSNEPQFMNLAPYLWRQGEVQSDNKTVSDMVVGEYDLTLQLDLWCRNKKERVTLFEKVFKALNPLVIPMGLSLKLENYFDTYARVEISSHSLNTDNDRSTEKREWRVRIDLLGNCKSVLSTTDYAIIETQAQADATTGEIPNP